ncbi:MAG: SDR family oxidoreductase, partial [Acidobacteria bacterium]|nr:SDR family oxidoreductase [Acidobacteriota bacterium]
MKKLGKLVLAGAAGAAVYALIKRSRRRDVAGFFEGKGVVVTGGASGIGLCLVDLLDLCGARVLAVDMDAEALAALRESLPDVETLELDLATPGAPEEMVRIATDVLGRIDVCFSNAGIIWAAPFLSMTDRDIERLISVNFQMQVLLTKALLPVLLDQGGGVIAYTGSLSSYVHSPMHSVYTG